MSSPPSFLTSGEGLPLLLGFNDKLCLFELMDKSGIIFFQLGNTTDIRVWSFDDMPSLFGEALVDLASP